MPSDIPRRILGSGPTALTVSQLGYGCMGFKGVAKEAQPEEFAKGVELLREVFRLGINFFDTAEVYGPYNSEIMLGEAIKTIPRDQVVISTKCGLYGDLATGATVADSHPERLRESLEGSLKRLGVDYIDLYFLHRVDPRVEPEVIANTMKQFIAEGKIRHWGVSEAAISTVRRMHAVCPLTAVQNEYSLMMRDPEAPNGLFATLEELGIGLVSFSPLGRALLTGAVNPGTQFDSKDFRASHPRYTGNNLAHNHQLVGVIEKFAAKKHATCAQIALSWVMHAKPYIVPIPGTTNLDRLRENIGAVGVQLSAAEMTELNEESAKIDIRGERYTPANLAMINH